MNRKMLYPPPEREEDGGGPSTKLRSNSYEPFRMLDIRIEEGLRGMAEEEQQRLEFDPKGVNGMSVFNMIKSSIKSLRRLDDLAASKYRAKLIIRSSSFSFSFNKSTMPYVPLPSFFHFPIENQEGREG